MRAVAPNCRRVKPPHRYALALPRCTRTLAVLTGCGLAAASAAQPAVPAVQRVEVVGAAPGGGMEVPRDQIPANVQRASGDDLERSHAADLSAYLARHLASVHINEVQGNPFQPDLSFRGFVASPVLGTPQGLSVYLDGVRLNQPFGDVVSWDLVPRTAIASLTLMPGSNPLFGLNTLGGALAIQTKDGLSDPGASAQILAGGHGRRAAEFEAGAKLGGGWHGYATGNRFSDAGWRVDSPSDVRQLFAKLGHRAQADSLELTVAWADNRLRGNALQEQGLLARAPASVYTLPDTTHNRSLLFNLAGTHALGSGWTASGNAYQRRVRSLTLNSDANGQALGRALTQPDAAERAALAAAGYSGFPLGGADAANTPFPSWPCIAQVLLASADPATGVPMTRCNAILNRSDNDQSNHGLTLNLAWTGSLAGHLHRALVGVALDQSRVRFSQGSQLGYFNPDRSVSALAAFVDGSELADDGSAYDNRVALSARSRSASLLGSDTLALDARSHLTLSARYNRSAVHNRDAITPGGGPGSLDTDQVFARWNPAVGLTHAASPGLTAYAGISQGSRAPSAVELGCADPASPCKLPNAFAGDPPLRQVRVNSWEAGLRGKLAGEGSWNLGLFHADSVDDILFVADAQSGSGYFKNFGRTRRQGLEAALRTRLPGGISLGANLTLLDATYQSAETLNGAGNSRNDSALAGLPGQDGNIAIRPGDRIPLVPQRLLKLNLDAPLAPGWNLTADLSTQGPSLARGNENNQHQSDGLYYLGPGRSAGFAVLNLGLDWQALPGLNAFAQVGNLADRRYASAAQLGLSAFDANGRYRAQPLPVAANGVYPLPRSTFLAPGAPRLLSLGLRWRFG